MTASTLKFTAKLARSLAAVFCVCTAIFSHPVVALATPARRCSRDTFSIGGQPLAVTVCVGAPGDSRTVVISETLRSAKGSFNHNCWIDILPGAPVSLGVDDVSLS